MASYLQVHRYRLNQLFDNILQLKLPPSAKVLDLGCYPPYLFRRLHRAGFDVFGISSSHELVIHPHIHTLNLEHDVFPFPSNQFDLVILSEVLEHLSTSPQHLFRQVRRVLKPGGYFVITTPNVLRWQNLFSLLLGHNIYFPVFQLSQNINHRHHREYTLTELRQLFDPRCFTVTTQQFLIAYPPYRPKNQADSSSLKLIKYLNYFLSLLFPSRRDTIFLLVRKN